MSPKLEQLCKLPEAEALAKLDEIIKNDPKLVALRDEVRETKTSLLLQNAAEPEQLVEALLGGIDNIEIGDLLSESSGLDLFAAAVLKVIYDEIDHRIPIHPRAYRGNQ